ncbi:sugar ABC transporter ATPase [Microbacterium lacus]|uniref:sugar ABC transporter ATPase n=1 Tax=Microbacterium lacus TaxID=415217 RepID=UPI000C2C8B57|nr:sugar ABC transporter ATPase [Microbacterium lacus]
MTDQTMDSGMADDAGTSVPHQPLSDIDTSIAADADADPAQAEWDGRLSENGAPLAEPATATGADPAEIPADDDDIPATDVRAGLDQPESQGEDPLIADLGDEGEGDLSPEDL